MNLALLFLLFIAISGLALAEERSNAQGLWINKTSNQSSYSLGEDISYTINFGNRGDTAAEKVVLVDLLPRVNVSYVEPAASSFIGNNLTWDIGTLAPGQNGSVTVIVQYPEIPNFNFQEESSVSGHGFVNIRKRTSTLEQNATLTNSAFISAIYAGIPRTVNASVMVRLGVRPIGYIKNVEHGSGRYKEELTSSLNNTIPSVKLKKDLSAQREQVDLNMTGKRTLTMNSPWSDLTYAFTNDKGTVSEVADEYRYMDGIDKETSYNIVGSGITYSSTGNFSGGMAQIGYFKKPSGSKREAAYISETYHGSFRTEQSLDSYGTSPTYKKETSGTGFVSSQKVPSCDLRSSEQGGGAYQSAESIQGGTIEKNITLDYLPLLEKADRQMINYASKWGETLYARNPEKGTEILNRFSSLDHMQMEFLLSSSYLSLTGEFNGSDYLKARAVADEKRFEDESFRLEQVFTGSYHMDAAIGLAQSIKYNYPHLNLTKRVLARDENTFTYRIWVNNDGAKTMEQVTVVDLLPERAKYISASLKPSVQGRVISWTLQALPSGETKAIDLKVSVDTVSPSIINRVQAAGKYGNRTIVSEAAASLYDTIRAEEITNETEELEQYTSTGDWKPPACFNITPFMISCEKEIDEYYNNLTGDCDDLP